MSEYAGSKEFTLPIGPVHLALEEPMYFRVSLEGEKVGKVEITSGHVHRGLEALAAKRNFFQNIILTERVCSLCSNSHPFAYCMALENLAKVTIPPRAAYLRVLAEETKRISSSLFNVGILAHIIGFKSLFMHVMQVRELMQDIKETVFGNRMDLAANIIGGVKYDLDDELNAYIRQNLAAVLVQVRELVDIYATDPMVLGRTRNVGVLPPEEAVRYAVVGPVARGSGQVMDVRREAPYAAYPELDFKTITEQGCDVHARAMVRLREIPESISIINQVLDKLPPGPLAAVLPIIPAGQAGARIEAPRGELFYYVRTDGTNIPTRLKWRVPSFMNWSALEVMMPGSTVADVPLIVNSIDPCVSCTER